MTPRLEILSSSSAQFGFRKKLSFDLAAARLSENILLNRDAGLYTGAVLLDVKKAFDSVDPEILLEKLNIYGFPSQYSTWLSSYLNNRYIFFGNSPPVHVRFGVPQGSTIGPLLFLLYVLDIHNSIQDQNCSIIQFADDTIILFPSKSEEVLNTTLQKEVDNLHQWFLANRLQLAPSKCQSIISNAIPKLNLTLDSTSIYYLLLSDLLSFIHSVSSYLPFYFILYLLLIFVVLKIFVLITKTQ